MQVNKLKLGVEVTGVELSKPLTEKEVETFKDLIVQHRIVVFRDQQAVSGQRQVELTELFGGKDTAVVKGDPLFGHPKCPHPDIYRISNDPDEGCVEAGRSGWHIDGAVFEKPFAYTILHVVSAPTKGATEFVGFAELLDSISPDTRQRWERLWTLPNKEPGYIHPLIYKHPVTKQTVMCFHLGFTKAFIWDYGTDKERVTSEEETAQIKKEIIEELTKNNNELVYAHAWQTGDFAVADNLAVVHFASADTQRPRSEVGLRILHRTTVRGTHPPTR